MNKSVTVVCAVLLAVPLCGGCVERKVLIRSEPSGATAWVDEKPVGVTPVEFPFRHYGRRRFRVGPIRGETDQVQYLAVERVVAIEPPWYQKIPVDFFAEVLWPGTLVDTHEVTLVLPAATDAGREYGLQRAEEALERAERFRDKALAPVPELE